MEIMTSALPSPPHVHAATVPFDVHNAVERSLNVGPLTMQHIAGGTNTRTFLAGAGPYSWILRVEPTGGTQLRRAFAAQAMAREVGVRVPEITAWELNTTSMYQHVWTVEEYVPGVTFVPQLVDTQATQVASDLGRQLRRLHDVPADAFGLLKPNPYTTYATFEVWLDDEARYIPEAVQASGMDVTMIPAISDVYARLREWYTQDPRLCHGDCGGANMLVQDARIAALVDWEWANGGDPASDVAYWSFWHEDAQVRENLLAAYGPEDAPAFRQRVRAFHVVHAVHLLAVFNARDHGWGIHFCSEKLHRYLEAGI